MSVVNLIIYIGILVFAITGALKARTHQMDVFGGLVLAFVTAYGGGTIRDVLIGIQPINWMNDYLALSLVCGAVAITFLFKVNFKQFKRTIFFTDAIGLGLFTAAGIERSLAHGINEVYAVIMGVMSATFGGLLADIISNQVPDLLKRGELYATACAIGGFIYIALQHFFKLSDSVNLWVCVASIVIIRVVSKLRKWKLPEV